MNNETKQFCDECKKEITINQPCAFMAGTMGHLVHTTCLKAYLKRMREKT